MRNYILIFIALTVVLGACTKVGSAEENYNCSQVFSATVEESSATKVTLENKTPHWECGDIVNINGERFVSKTSGRSTLLYPVITKEIRPAYVSSNSIGYSLSEMPKSLVDADGTRTKWCAGAEHREGGAWNIVVSLDSPSLLMGINLWNGDDTEKNPGRRWKNIRVSGSSSANGDWEEIGTYLDLNLATGNRELAGSIQVRATKEFQFYMIEVLSAEKDNVIQMSDMKFVVLDESQSHTEFSGPYSACFPASLYDGGITVLPAELTETFVAGRFDMPMYAYSTDSNLEFKNLCGVLKITVGSDKVAKVKSINVSSSNFATSGAFTVGEDNAARLVDPTDASRTSTITYNPEVITDAAGTVFYVPLPPQEYRDLKILVSDGNRVGYMTTREGAAITVERNRLYSIVFDPMNVICDDPDLETPGLDNDDDNFAF